MYYKRILDELPELIYVTHPDGVTPEFCNKTWYSYTGLTEEDVLLGGWKSIVAPQDVERVASIIGWAVKNKESYELEVRLKCREGDYRWFLSQATPVFNEQGSILSYIGRSLDIHDIKLSLEETYEKKLERRVIRIKELEKELELHKTAG